MPKQKLSNEDKRTNRLLHTPVLLNQVLRYLDPKPGESYLDMTAGYGGHARAVTDKTAAPDKAVLVDRDEKAISYLSQHFDDGTQLLRADFLSASKRLSEAGRHFDMIMADLGVSSPHLEEAERGFSFSRTGPLDMRMDASQTLTAGEIVNHWTQDQIEHLIREYGEEPKARWLAREIVKSRPLKTTEDLVKAIERVRRLKNRRINRATKVFQALRIAVNDELAQLENSLPIWLELLSPAGRIVVISFHSLEDRLVKTYFAEHGADTYDAQLKLLTKKPVLADRSEIVSNPRARSARLRAAVKK